MLKSESRYIAWWHPQPNVVIDVRDISGFAVSIGPYFNPDTTTSINGLKYHLLVSFSNKSKVDDVLFTYDSIEELNTALAPFELSWIPDEVKE
jgi:hypothetical protein